MQVFEISSVNFSRNIGISMKRNKIKSNEKPQNKGYHSKNGQNSNPKQSCKFIEQSNPKYLDSKPNE